jgi:hypothetical protein
MHEMITHIRETTHEVALPFKVLVILAYGIESTVVLIGLVGYLSGTVRGGESLAVTGATTLLITGTTHLKAAGFLDNGEDTKISGS